MPLPFIIAGLAAVASGAAATGAAVAGAAAATGAAVAGAAAATGAAVAGAAATAIRHQVTAIPMPGFSRRSSFLL